jgi:Meckel syndrome type 1 protein
VAPEVLPEPAVKPAEKPVEKPAVKPAEKPAVKPAAKPTDKPAETPAAKPAGTAVAAGADLPVGAPLTSSEVSGIKGAISKVWNKATLERMPNFEDLVITMRITLDQQGKIVGNPEMIRPASTSDPRFAQAERAAATALMRAQPYDLPPGKFARWQVIEVTFNPGLGVSM